MVDIKIKNPPKHPWRRCPIGWHYVKAHVVHYPPSTQHPNGFVSERRSHCAKNPSKKDFLSFDEIQYITKNASETTLPIHKLKWKNSLPKFDKPDQYDVFIIIWVEYWNDILKPIERLDPLLIKALIATESGFRAEPPAPNAGKKQGRARGLLQVTDDTLRILNQHDGELKNYLLQITNKQLLDPSSNICAGIRWLFRKKQLASLKLKREANWEESIAEYKGYLNDMLSGKNPTPKGVSDLGEYYSKLKDINLK